MSDRIKKLVSKGLADFVKDRITEMDGYCKNWEITRKAEAAHSKNSDPKVASNSIRTRFLVQPFSKKLAYWLAIGESTKKLE